jgi:plasmid stabilization system protein ParE
MRARAAPAAPFSLHQVDHSLRIGLSNLEDTMPSWSNKDRRKYEHIKESSEERGVSEERAEKIAARTVNKGRREEGRTPNKRTQGTGNPTHRLEERSKEELYNRAKEMGIHGRSRMDKQELVHAIRSH